MMVPDCIRLIPNWVEDDFRTYMMSLEVVTSDNEECFMIGVAYAVAILQRVVKEAILMPKLEDAKLVVRLLKELQQSKNVLNKNNKWGDKIDQIIQTTAKFSREQCQSMALRYLEGYQG